MVASWRLPTSRQFEQPVLRGSTAGSSVLLHCDDGTILDVGVGGEKVGVYLTKSNRDLAVHVRLTPALTLESVEDAVRRVADPEGLPRHRGVLG